MKASYKTSFLSKTLILFSLLLLVLAVSSATAHATVLGTTSFPAGATAQSCTSGAFYAQFSSDPAYNYVVPANNGQITSWSTNTTGDTPGQTLSLVILRPNAMTMTTGAFSIVGFDNETIPSPLPANSVATFNIPTPISVKPR